MFAEHQPRIGAFARANSTNFRKVATFVVCTIRTPLYAAAKDVGAAFDGKPCKSIFGGKHAALDALARSDLYEELEYLYTLGASEDAMLRATMTINGLGLAKAGFVLQMAYGLSGCLDTHNLSRFGISERHFQTGHKSADRRRLPEYNAMCRKLGGTAKLWDAWCRYVADTQPGAYDSAEHVSRLHLAPLEC